MPKENNLTALRWLAAGLVLYGHSFVFLGLPEPSFMSWLPLGTLGVYIFFSISGYLVTQSWHHDAHLGRFLKRRALRIFPGLIVCILFTVVVLGPILTHLKISDYFTHPNTLLYLRNIGLYISYSLPGVFETNHYPAAVNGSLWSLPVEFFMYLILSILGYLKLPRFGFLLSCIGFVFIAVNYESLVITPWIPYGTDMKQVFVCGSYFWLGSLFYTYKIPRFFTTSNLLVVLFIWISMSRWPSLFVLAGFLVIPVMALAFGLSSSPLFKRMTHHDYSYGIYIYAFPIQQTLAYIQPDLPLPMYLFLASFSTILLAAVSWNFIEKQALKLKPATPIFK